MSLFVTRQVVILRPLLNLPSIAIGTSVAVLAIPVAFLIVFFAVRYRAGARPDRSRPPETNMKLEMTWIIIR